MPQNTRYVIAVFFIFILVKPILSHGMVLQQPDDPMRTDEQESVFGEYVWAQFEVEHEKIFGQNFNSTELESDNISIQHFLEEINSLIDSIGLDVDDEPLGVWSICERCSVAIPSYLLLLKARCLLVVAQGDIEKNEGGDNGEVNIRLIEVEKLMSKVAKYDKLSQEQGKGSGENLLLLLVRRHHGYLVKMVESQQNKIIAEIKLSQEQKVKLKRNTYFKAYFDYLRKLVSKENMETEREERTVPFFPKERWRFKKY